MQVGPMQEWQHKSLVCCVAQEGSEKENDMEKEEEVTAEKDVPIGIETHLNQFKTIRGRKFRIDIVAERI